VNDSPPLLFTGLVGYGLNSLDADVFVGRWETHRCTRLHRPLSRCWQETTLKSTRSQLGLRPDPILRELTSHDVNDPPAH
jgi:hypothetical protein